MDRVRSALPERHDALLENQGGWDSGSIEAVAAAIAAAKQGDLSGRREFAAWYSRWPRSGPDWLRCADAYFSRGASDSATESSCCTERSPPIVTMSPSWKAQRCGAQM